MPVSFGEGGGDRDDLFDGLVRGSFGDQIHGVFVTGSEVTEVAAGVFDGRECGLKPDLSPPVLEAYLEAIDPRVGGIRSSPSGRALDGQCRYHPRLRSAAQDDPTQTDPDRRRNGQDDSHESSGLETPNAQAVNKGPSRRPGGGLLRLHGTLMGKVAHRAYG